MFSYYGSKSRVVQHYPEPQYNTIIEPFAGSARYSLRYFNRQCWLNDKYKVLVDIWNWMIAATPSEIDSLPDLKKGDDVRKLGLPEVVRNLMGFSVNNGVAKPHNIYTKWAETSAKDGRIAQVRRKLHEYCGKLTHWKVTNLDYREMENVEATWFIDPPYVNGGKRYVENQIDYRELAEWCLSRKGQVIVCETLGADWLPFQKLCVNRGSKRQSVEVVFHRPILTQPNEQLSITPMELRHTLYDCIANI